MWVLFNMYKILKLSLKVPPFNSGFQKKNENFHGGVFFQNFSKSPPKSPNFGLKSPIFGRIQKFFFSSPSTFRDLLRGIKQIFFPNNYMVSRTKKRFSPISGSENGVRPISAPRGPPGQIFFYHKLGVGGPSQWAISR